MTVINSELLQEVVYNLCLQAAQELSPYSYNLIKNAFSNNKTQRLAEILQNAEKAHKIRRPLCQDTGSVHVFLEVGNEISFSSNPTKAINKGVEKCYIEQYFRKSVVENTFLSGKNRENNTPALINIEYTEGNSLKIGVLLKGAGCDNVSEIQMLLPTTSEEEFVHFCAEKILEKGKNACPPVFVSIAVGGGAENVMANAEKAYFSRQNDLSEISQKIKALVKENEEQKYAGFYLSDVLTVAKPHHMASLPVAIAFNCHSLRVSQAEIKNGKVQYSKPIEDFIGIDTVNQSKKEINTNNIDEIRRLKEGEEVFLTGEILIARDAAHKKMLKMKKSGENLPFDLNNKMIFYAAPCPANPSEIVGPIGPTTAHRMDKFLDEFPEVLATLGKGPRSNKAADVIRKNNSVYFEISGGIATLLASCFKKCEIIAFEELSTEAVYLAEVEKLPVKVSII